MQGKKILEDPETRELITKEQLLSAYAEYEQLLHVLYDLDSGLVTLTLTDYKRLPHFIVKALRLYHTIKSDYQKP
ncbi:MAG: hypothetical protein EPO24_09400 [Bacteroidetes bacterium]|nr:MAG: hypothetical protein EPO24_09400 [Bacteroidota bacterium]